MRKTRSSTWVGTTVAALVSAGSMTISAPVQACAGDDPYLGTICMTANTYCPRGYAEAKGTLLQIQDFTALYALIGTNYGGDGHTSFALPDLRGRLPVGTGQSPGTSYIQQGWMLGQESVTLAVDQMPSHSHAVISGGGGGAEVQVSQEPGSTNVPDDGSYLAAPPGIGPNQIKIYNDGGSLVDLGGVSGSAGSIAIATTGGSTSVPIVPPQTAIRYCIAVEGLFPPRP